MKRSGAKGDGSAIPPDLARPALRAFFGLAIAWRLSEQEQMKLLGISTSSTLDGWKAGEVWNVTHETLERISCMLGIFKAINILLPNPARADAWIRAPNDAPLFGGRSALDRMSLGTASDLYLVRQYLEGQCI